MQYARYTFDFRASRVMRHSLAIFACLALFAGCQFGERISLFDQEGGIEQAVAALRERIGGRVYALNVAITPDEVTIRAQNPSDRSHIDEWRLVRVHMASFNWQRISGPAPYQPSLINPDLEANLFDLDEVDFSGASKLARAAVERAALANKAQVMRMEIARQVFIVPQPSSGEVRWTVDVRNVRESAEIFADAGGTIVGANLDGTLRAKTLDIFQKLDMVADAARTFRFILGLDRILSRVGISQQSVGFETIIPDPYVPVQVSGTLKSRKVYRWTINGLARAIAAVNADAPLGSVREEPFSVDDVDWAALPKIVAVAAQQLAMPQGHVTGIEVSKPANPLGPSIVLWKIEITDQNKEKGFVLADITGAVKQVIPPESRRKRTDWHDPAMMIRAVSASVESETALTFCFIAFSTANRFPPPDQVRGHASPENALAGC